MIKSLCLVVCTFLALAALAPAEERTIAPKGVYKEIKTTRELKAISTFMKGTEKQKEKLAEAIQEHPEQYAPVVFFHLSRYLFEQEEEDDALFWLYAGRLRTWYDVKRCTDRSVESATEVLSQQLPPLLRLIQFEDLDNSAKILKKVVAWDRKTPHEYDARWIALHGIKAALPLPADGKQDALTIPEDQWKDLAETHRKEYLKTYLEGMKALEPEQIAEIEAKIKKLRAEAEEAAEDEDESDEE